jgi:hypothetical protein
MSTVSRLRTVPTGLSLGGELRDLLSRLRAAAFSPYRPEQHYMRGPGPACRAKAAARNVVVTVTVERAARASGQPIALRIR